MKEQLISLDTAKLAKEKEFNIPTRDFYTDLSWSPTKLYNCTDVGYPTHTSDMDYEHGFGDILLTPTQSLLQKWLREEHGIVLTIAFIRQNSVLDGYEFFYDCSIKIFDTESTIQKDFFPRKGLFKSYEKALEAGLQEALKLIK